MALVVSNDMALGDFETAMYQAWGQKNDDGVGIFWRDFPQKENEMPLHLHILHLPVIFVECNSVLIS